MWGRVCPHVLLLLLANIFKASCEGTSSLTFVIDDTGSMTEDIDQVKSSVDKITDIVFNEKSSLIYDMVLVTVNDPDSLVRVVTNESSTFKTALDAVYAHNINNYDCWEPSMKGLLQALERSRPGSYLYVFTDATAKDHVDSAAVIEMCQRKQSQITFVLTGRCWGYQSNVFKVYYDIAAACSGLAFYVKKNEVDQVLRTLEETIKGNKTVLTTRTVPPGVYTDIPFTIDEYTDYAIVSVSGTGVSLGIAGPFARQERIMWNDNGKVMKLNDAVPGKYVATVMGNSSASVVIVGRTDFLFSHGFSELEPKQLSDTTPQPIADANVHLSISVTNPKHEVRIDSAQILQMDEKPIQELSLREISSDFYITKPFVAPSQMFKVAVKGIVKATGKPITRIAKTPITTQKPPKKFPSRTKRSATKQVEVEYGGELTLSCPGAGFPRPTTTWYNSNGAVMPSWDVPTYYNPLFEYASNIRIYNVLTPATYYCYTTNGFAFDYVYYIVKVKDPLVVQAIPAATTNVVYGSAGTITCDIRSKQSMNILWYYVNEKTGGNSQIFTSNKYWISPDGTQLKINKMDLDSVGTYTCKASLVNNNGMQKTYSTRLQISGLTSPTITSNSKAVIKGLEGDLALRIPCDVVGVPQPVITWKLKGVAITPNAKYSIENGALVVMNPNGKDSEYYTCEAKNDVNSVSATFQANVDKFLTDLGVQHNVYLLEDDTKQLKCEAYSSTTQSVRWFINGEEKKTIKTPYFQVINASVSDDGNYTCSVSDKHGNTYTHTNVLNVGRPPNLYDQTLVNNWRGDINEILSNCESDAEPPADVHWKFNGKVLTDRNLKDLGISYQWGNYSCNVSNVHGSVQRTFDVKSSACLINRNLKDAHNMPLLLTDGHTWPLWETTKHYLVVEQEENITLSCPNLKEAPNAFQKFPKQSELKAYCYKQDEFLVEGKLYKLSDLHCTNGIQPTIIRKKVKCLTDTSELIRVGYNVTGFLETYEVCFDHAKNMPLYTRALMTETDGSLDADQNWHKYPGIGDGKRDRGFTCENTLSTCCYSQSQLVTARDFNYSPAKYTTFIDPLNAIPLWRPCKNATKTTWEDIDVMVRSQFINYDKIVAWSGTHTLQEKDGAVIPRFLWKVLRFDEDEPIAIVHVNDPLPTDKDIKCVNKFTTDKISWFTPSDEYTYCCKLSDFLQSFDFHGTDIGDSKKVALEKIEKRT